MEKGENKLGASRFIRTYTAVPGSHINNKDAETFGQFIDQKFGDNGTTPAQIVKSAEPKRSPIHKYFEWDDSVAAHEYRQTQARLMLRSIQIKLVSPNEDEVVTRAFQSIKVVESDGEIKSRYMPAHVVWSNEDMSLSVRNKAKRELELWSSRYEQYSEMHGTILQVRLVIEEILRA
jgi:hypothetical protein